MKIWIISPYGNLPGEGWREYRSTLMAKAFNSKGHQVVWWVSNFEHRSKKFRSESWKDLQVNENFLIKMVPTSSYTNHISIARINHERNYAKRFREKVLNNNEKPDLMIVGEPALFYSEIILQVIKKMNVPFIVDICDLWPELFSILLPVKLSFLSKIFFFPLYLKRKLFLRKADGIIGATTDYLGMGTSYNSTSFKDTVYLGIDTSYSVKDDYEDQSLKYFKKRPEETWAIYAGTLGNNYDIHSIIECAKKIDEQKLPIKIYIAGEGSLRSLLVNTIKSEKIISLIYLGKLSAIDLSVFYRNCDLAISSYVKKSTVSMPVKAFDYLAAGLPLINSLNRELGQFVVIYNIGLQYIPENSDDMLRAIVHLAFDKEKCKLMRNNALSLAKTFDFKLQYIKAVALAENLIEFKNHEHFTYRSH